MLQEIKDIYNYRRDDNSPMLSTYEPSGLDFWKPYRDNFAYYDRLFMKKYRSWFPMDQEGDIEDVSTDFSYDVKSWLMINDKRYSELFRMQIIPDDDKYSLTDNVFEHELIEESGEHSSEFNKGAQTDTEDLSATKGSQTDTQDNSRTLGTHTDTQDNSRTFAQQTVDTDASNETDKSTSAYNDTGFDAVDKVEETIDQSVVTHEHTDTEDLSTTIGEQTNTEDLSTTYGQRTDTEDNSRTSGARKDTDEGSDSRTTERTRSGNIGVMTVDQMLKIHKDVWVDFSFYELIFAEIARELLRGVR